MAILFYLGQVPAQWFTEAGDGVLSGGVLRFFEVGTSSPKAVYSDYQGTTAAGTSVTLDTSGRANVFLNGLYSVTLEDADGVQIGPKVDGVGDGSALGLTTTSVVANYDGLRALDGDDARAATVEGRVSSGDGGAGLFVWDILATDPDDGGTILKPTSNPTAGRWRRVIGDTIDPRWYGVVMDGTTVNVSTFAVAVAASVSMKSRLHFEGGYCRLASNATIPANARLSCGMRGGITSTSAAVLLHFAAGSRFDGGAPECFAGQLQPMFALGTADEIPLSWMGAANAEARLDKWAAADGGALYLGLDVVLSSSSLPTFVASSRLIPRGGRITVTGVGQNLSIEVEYDGFASFVTWANVAAIGTVFVGNRECRPEWFGAVGNGSTDDTVPMLAALKTGRVEFARKAARYKVANNLTVGAIDISGVMRGALASGTISSDPATIPSPCIIMADGKSISTSNGDCSLSGIGFYAKEVGGGIDCGTADFYAAGCVIACYNFAGIEADGIGQVVDSYLNSSLVFAAGTRAFSNIRTNAEPARRLFGEVTQLEGAYITDCANGSADYDAVLTTDADGLVSPKHSLSLETISLETISVDAVTPRADGFKRVDSTYTVQDSDPQILIVDPTTAPVTVTLPKAAAATLKLRYIMCAYAGDSNNVIVTGDVFTDARIPEGYTFRTLGIFIYDEIAEKWAWG